MNSARRTTITTRLPKKKEGYNANAEKKGWYALTLTCTALYIPLVK